MSRWLQDWGSTPRAQKYPPIPICSALSLQGFMGLAHDGEEAHLWLSRAAKQLAETLAVSLDGSAAGSSGGRAAGGQQVTLPALMTEAGCRRILAQVGVWSATWALLQLPLQLSACRLLSTIVCTHDGLPLRHAICQSLVRRRRTSWAICRWMARGHGWMWALRCGGSASQSGTAAWRRAA